MGIGAGLGASFAKSTTVEVGADGRAASIATLLQGELVTITLTNGRVFIARFDGAKDGVLYYRLNGRPREEPLLEVRSIVQNHGDYATEGGVIGLAIDAVWLFLLVYMVGSAPPVSSSWNYHP